MAQEQAPNLFYLIAVILIVASFFVLLVTYFFSPDTQLGTLSILFDSAGYIRARMNEALIGTGVSVILESQTGVDISEALDEPGEN